jgi:hypothetical protein
MRCYDGFLQISKVATEPSGREVAREPPEDELWFRSFGGVGQPLQLLAQRGLGARQQVGSRPVATAL